MGAKCISRATTQACSDTKNFIFTAPAFMKETNDFHEIFNSIETLVISVQKGLEGFKSTQAAKKDAEKAKKKAKREAKAAKKEKKEKEVNASA